MLVTNETNKTSNPLEVQLLGPAIRQLDLTPKVVFLAMFLIVAVLNLFFNFCALYLLYQRRCTTIRKALVFCDILLSLFHLIFETGNFWSDFAWIFGAKCCKSMPFFRSLLMNGKSCILGYIAMTRYKTLLKPGYFTTNHQKSATTVLHAIFIVCGVYSAPFLFFFTVVDGFVVYYDGELLTYREVQLCIIKPNIDYIYVKVYYFLVLLTLFVPLIFIIVFYYTRIVLFLWFRKPISSDVSLQTAVQIARKKKVTRTVMLLIFFFIFCNAPMYILICFSSYMKLSPSRIIIREVICLLSLANGSINPFLYVNVHVLLRTIFVRFSQSLSGRSTTSVAEINSRQADGMPASNFNKSVVMTSLKRF